MKTAISLVSALVLVIGIGMFVYTQKEAIVEPPVPEPDSGIEEAEDAPIAAQVSLHRSGESCWTIINGSVYDLTSWIPNHPGGEQAILQLCGTDGSAKFNGQHGGSSRQETILSGFRIGSAE